MKIKVGKEKYRSINPNMIGLFFEDINYAADGGLYAEMIENRSFSFVRTEGNYNDYYTFPAGDYGWEGVNPNRGNFNIVSGSSLSENNPNYARVNVLARGYGLKNKAYEGVFLKKDMKYNIVIWAREKGFDGNLCVCVKKDGAEYASTKIDFSSFIDEKYNFWRLYSVSFTAIDDVDNADFIIEFDGIGTVELSYVSMIPDDAVMGIFRKDLFDLLNELHPGFIRFPGGCIVEGNTLQNRYSYKNTLLPTWDRKTNWNRWAVHDNKKERNNVGDYAWYNQTLGLGFFEYFLLCELIGAKPLPVLSVGLACQYQTLEKVSVDSEEFASFVQDAIDLIEFANGPVDSKWGSVRAKMGHEAPFNLEFIGIGNEQWQTENIDFFERYKIFEEAVHEVYPNIKLIGSAGPDITSERYTMAWSFYRKNKHVRNFAFALDEHYYVKPEYLLQNNDFYDNYDRDIKVFSGEYAAHPFSCANGYKANTLYGAISEAAFLTGVERNADVVVLASYAPLFARVNYAQWAPDMIWFDSKVAYGSPSYHVQKMYANNMGDSTINVENLNEAVSDNIFYNISFDSSSNETIIKIVNANESERFIDFDIEGTAKDIRVVSLTGPYKDAYNFVDAPKRVNTEDYSLDNLSNVKLTPYSFSVIRFNYL